MLYRGSRAALALSLSLLMLLTPGGAWAGAPQTTAAVALPAAQAPGKRPLRHNDYDLWRSVASPTLSRDGKWAVYALAQLDADGELVARSTVDGTERHVPRGRLPIVTADSKFVVFTINAPQSEIEKARKDKKPAPPSAQGILDLSTGKVETIEKVRRSILSKDGARYVAYLMEPATGARPTATPPAPTGDTLDPQQSPSIVEDAADTGDADEDFQGRRPAGAAGQRPGGAPGQGGAAGAPAASAGTDLVVRDLSNGASVTISDVTDAGFNDTGGWLWYVVDGKDDSKDGVYVREMGKDTSLALATGPGVYRSVAFAPRETRVAFLKTPAPPKPAAPAAAPNAAAPAAAPSALTLPPGVTRAQALEILRTTPEQAKPFLPPGMTVEQAIAALEAQPPTPAPAPAAVPAVDDTPRVPALWLWSSGESAAKEIVSEKTAGMPAGRVVAPGAPRFSRDGEKLILATTPAPKPRAKDAPEPVNVDIWSSRDGLIQTMQKLRAEQDRAPSYAALWWIRDAKLVSLSDAELPQVAVPDTASRYVLGSNPTPYLSLMLWDTSYADIYRIDLKTGARTRLLTKESGGARLSADENHLLWWDDSSRSWWSKRLDRETPALNLTKDLGVAFYDEQDDHPAPPPTLGIAGFTSDHKSVVLQDRYDLWLVDLDGHGARALTTGRKSEMIFRYTRLDPDEQTIPVDKPILLSVTDDRTKGDGYWRMASLTSRPEKLFSIDKSIAGLQKAKDSDRIVFTMERFDEFPDLWTAPNVSSMENRTRLTDANPQQKNYVWGRSELVEYTTADGKPMRAILTVPENFDPSKKYPMLVYIYERMTDGLHTYIRPNVGTSINVSRYVSNGYIVLRPDIAYTSGYPGESALKCVVPAVNSIVARGFVDPARIGIQGHSWGAYQIAYLVTRTNLFRCVEAGAAVSDMVSAYGGIRYESGMSRAFQYERTQSRIGAPPWQMPLQYIENSPVFWVDKVQTPYLTIHNDADGAVPWTQGIEFYIALRRLGKEAYLFNYNGEGHGLTNRENMKHWTVHMAEFFDHYLLGAPRPAWMDSGVPYIDRGTRDMRPFYAREGQPGAPTTAGGPKQ